MYVCTVDYIDFNWMQASIMSDMTLWSNYSGQPSSSCRSNDHCILFADDSVAEHLDDAFEILNCVRVLFTRGAKGCDAEEE
jgi:hypothetical protein